MGLGQDKRVCRRPLGAWQMARVIGVQAPFIVVDEYAGGDMHGVYKGQHVLLHMPLSFS
jgi:hypothetical protein